MPSFVEIRDALGVGRQAPPAEDEKQQRILRLEEKVAAQRARIRELEECREFERDTEEILIGAILSALDHAVDYDTRISLVDAVTEYIVRKGTRLDFYRLRPYAIFTATMPVPS